MRKLVTMLVLLNSTGVLAISAKDFCRSYEEAKGPTELERRVHQCREIINSGISQGRFTFEQGKAKTCIDSFAKKVEDKAECKAVLRGKKADSEVCESSFDCMLPFICRGKRGAPPGTCQVPLKEGDACDNRTMASSRFITEQSRSVCAEGLTCKPKDQVLRCLK